MPPSLKSRIRGGESAVLEFKASSPAPWKLARVIAAFANSAGGDLCIGVDDRGGVVGVDDVEVERAAVASALALLDPPPEIELSTYVHELKDVLVVTVRPVEYPGFCHLMKDGESLLYFRVLKETRPVTREVERAVFRLRRHARGRRSLGPEARRLLNWLWTHGEAKEATCARKLNFSSHRLRKLAESMIGAGYLVPCRMGEGRTYVAIRPGPGRG